VAPMLLDTGEPILSPPMTVTMKKTSPLAGLPVKAVPFSLEYDMKEQVLILRISISAKQKFWINFYPGIADKISH
jgi:hypothetical protein